MSEFDDAAKAAALRRNAERVSQAAKKTAAQQVRDAVNADWAKVRDTVIRPTLDEAMNDLTKNGFEALVKEDMIDSAGGGPQSIELRVTIGKDRIATLTFRHREHAVHATLSGTSKAGSAPPKDSRAFHKGDASGMVRDFIAGL